MIVSDRRRTLMRFGAAIVIVVAALAYLAWTGVEQSKSYYVTIKELQNLDGRYSKRLRVAGTVVPGSIRRQGTHVEFTLKENENLLNVSYSGTEAPPDTFKDDSQALAEGTYGRDGVFRASQLQAKCASKYAPQKPGDTQTAPGGAPVQKTAVVTGLK
jgi:cytochrome c-type biogenesis protein CcmE